MSTVKTSELSGDALFDATARALGLVDGTLFRPNYNHSDLVAVMGHMQTVLRSPINGVMLWHARAQGSAPHFEQSTDPVEAMCRAVVFARLGATVELPGGLDVGDDCADLFA